MTRSATVNLPERAIMSNRSKSSPEALAKLRGSIPPLVTPFVNGEVDYDTYARLVNFQIEQGTHGILVNGTTAEPSTLTLDERNELVTLAVRPGAGRGGQAHVE